MTRWRDPRRLGLVGLGIVVLALAVWGVPRWLHRGDGALAIPTAVIGRRDIAQTVEATGTVQPVEVVEIKSKASGQILRMPVEIGSVVRAGDLLAQIDTVTVRNQYDQAFAALQAARASVQVTTAQKQRADELFSRGVVTADEHEAATLAYANALSALARARADLDNARLALADVNVRAPSAGTVIEQDVTRGQVIASATASASGGTTLLKMADLSRIQMNALVGETDIGSVWPGQPATVTVDAFPQHRFRGRVVKIEPQAVIQQSVTMFPVLVAIENENGLLLPGMNGEVTISIEQRDNVLAVPLDAVRSMRELTAVAAAMDMDADSLRAEVRRQTAAWMPAGPGGAGGGGAGAGGWARNGASAPLAPGGAAAGPGGTGRPNGGAWTARGMRPGAGTGGAWRARGMGRAGSDSGAGWRAGGMGRPGAGRGAGGGWMGAGPRRGGAATAALSDSARRAAAGIGRPTVEVAFLRTAHGFEPRAVRIGVSDYDYAEVLDGLKEGDEVALVSVAEVQAQRQQTISRIRQRVGGGLPGAGGGPRNGGARPAGGAR